MSVNLTSDAAPTGVIDAGGGVTLSDDAVLVRSPKTMRETLARAGAGAGAGGAGAVVTAAAADGVETVGTGAVAIVAAVGETIAIGAGTDCGAASSFVAGS